MNKLRIAVLKGVTAATLLVALVAPATVSTQPRANFCDVENLWAATVSSLDVRSNGAVVFSIFNQAPLAPEDNDGSESFALASKIALGLGNAGEGDKYHFRFQTLTVSSGATARGHGFLFVPAETGMATFVVAGKGTHPLGGGMVPPTPGSFKLSGSGSVACAMGQGTGATAFVDVQYQDGTPPDNSAVTMVRCTSAADCPPTEG